MNINNPLAILIFLFVLLPVKTSANMERQFSKQKIYQCSYENAQYENPKSKYRYCINQNKWIAYSSSGYSTSQEGTLNNTMRTTHYDYEVPTSGVLRKRKLEGLWMVEYYCESDGNKNNFDCTGTVNKEFLAVRIDNFNGSVLQIAEKNYSDAIKRLTFGIKVEPENYMLFFLRSTAKFDSGNYKGALVDISTAINMNENLGGEDVEHDILCGNYERFISDLKVVNRSKLDSRLIRRC